MAEYSNPWDEWEASKQNVINANRRSGEGVSGALGDLGRGIAGGLTRGAEMALGAAEWALPEGSDLEQWADEAGEDVADFRENRPRMFGESQRSIEARESSPWNPRGWLYEGGSGVGLLAPGIATTVATGGLGAPALLSVGAGSAVTGAQFWGGTAQEAYDEILEKRPDIADSEATTYANLRGAIEGGTEAIATAIPFSVARIIPRSMRKKLVQTAAGAAGVGPLGIAKNIAKTAAAEVPTELAQETGGMKVGAAYGVNEEPTFADVAPVIGPTIIMSTILGGGASLNQNAQRKKIANALTQKDVPQQVRAQAADVVAKEVERYDPELAQIWRNQTAPLIAENKPVAILDDQQLRDFAKPTMTEARREAKASGGDALDQAAASAGVQSQEINTLGEQKPPGLLQLDAPTTQRPALPEPDTIFAGGVIPQASPQGYDPRGSQDEGQRGTERMEPPVFNAEETERQQFPQLEAPVEDVEAREIVNIDRRLRNLESFTRGRRVGEQMQRNMDRLRARKAELEQSQPSGVEQGVEQQPAPTQQPMDVGLSRPAQSQRSESVQNSPQAQAVAEVITRRRNAQAFTVTDPQAKMDGYVFVNGGRKNDKWQVIGPNGKPRPVSRTLLERFDRARSQGQVADYVPAEGANFPVEVSETPVRDTQEALPSTDDTQSADLPDTVTAQARPAENIESGITPENAENDVSESSAPNVEEQPTETAGEDIEARIAEAEKNGVALSDSDKKKIVELSREAEDQRRKAGVLADTDPMNKGNAFPLGVGFTKMTRRKERAIDSSIDKATKANALFGKAESAEKSISAMLEGKGTESDIAEKAKRKARTRLELAAKFSGLSKGDVVGGMTVERVSKDRDGYPSSFTISGKDIIKGVNDKVDIVREFFGGDKDGYRELINEVRSKAGEQPTETAGNTTQEATNGLQEGRKEEVGDDTSRYSRKKSASLKKADIGEFETGKKVSFNFVHNTESATSIFGKPSRSSPYDRGFEPSGRYVTPVGSVPDQLTDNMISGTLTFNNPLVIPNTDNGKSWKKALSEAYGGKRGKKLSLEIIKDGHDGIVTVDETRSGQKYASEILDLTTFDETKALYSRTTPTQGTASLSDISTHIDTLTGKWADSPIIAVVQSESDLPAALQRDIESVNAQGQVRGVFHRGRIHLVADNISTTAQAEEALFHEALGHYGMRRLFGPQFNQSMAKLYTALGKEAGIRRLAEQYGIDLKDYLDNAGHLSATQRERMLVDELVSHLLGDNVQPNLVQRVVGAIRNAIRRMGLAQLADFNNADLLRLVRLSREAVTKGKRGSVIVTAAPSVTDFNQPLRGMPENIVQMMMGSDLSRIDQTQTEPSKEDSFVYRRKDGEIGEGFTQWADDPDIIEHYGDTMWRVPVDELMSADDFIALAKPVIEEGYKNGRLSASAEEMIDEHGIDAVVADLNPDDIVDSAAAWDWDSPFSEYLYDELIEKENIKGIKTNNGAVVFDNTIAEKFDPQSQDIRYARSRPRGGVGPAPSIREKLSPKVKDATDYLRMKWQDKFTPVRLAQDELERLGWVKTEENDAYLAEELFHGKAATRLDNFYDDRIKPLTERMKELNLDTQNVEDYLYAKFAPERNAHVARVNKKMPYAGSGMFATRAEKQQALEEGFNHLKDLRVAEDVLAELTPKMDALQQIEPMVREITQMQRDIIRNEGLEGEEIVDAWELSSKNYIPLKGGKQERPSVGQGFGVKGSGTKRALGRSTEAENILAHLFGQVSDTIVRAEKVKVSRAFLRMVEENPSDAWEIHETIPTRRTMAKNAELTAARKKLGELKRQLKVADSANKSDIYARIAELEQAIPQMPEMSVREIADFNFTQSENVVPITREDGSVVYVEIAEDAKFGGTTGKDLGRVMKNMTAGQHGKTLQVLGAFTRYLSKMSTMFNPEFVITNFERDLQTAMINLSGEQSAKMAKNVLKSVPSSIRGIHNALRGDKSHEMAKWYKRFREAGGGISFMDLRGVEHIQKDIETALKGDRNKARVAARKLGDLIGDYNSMFENAARLSAFKVAVESGMSEAKAASIAKNLTVNFNRKGELGPAMNALYMFFNAGMQGSARIFGALKSKRTRQIVGTIMLAAWGLAEMNRYMAGDDEDDVNKWDKVNPYLKHTNIILMRPDGAPIKVKLPYGYNVFVAMGYAMSDIFHWMQGDGGKNPMEAGKDLTIAAMNAFNPLGGDNGPLQMLSPTVTDPLVDIAVNENFMGNPIVPEQPPWGPKKPESELYFRSVSPLSKSITQAVNELTGGNKWEPGLVSVSPEILDHMYDFIGGGALRSARDMVMLPAELSKEKPSIRRIPFLRQVFSDLDTRFDINAFYDNMEQVEIASTAVKELPIKERRRYMQEHPEFLLKKYANTFRKQMSNLRKLKYAAEDRGDERAALRIEERMKRLAMQFNKRFNEVTD